MSTTSLKLPEDVKELAVAAAERLGVTPHAFMVEAIRTAIANAEKRALFVASALEAREELIASGKGYAAEEVHAYARARAKGQVAKKPKARSWRD